MPDRFDLETFRTRHFDYRDGHNVILLGPTQLVGKTTTAYQLLDVMAAPERPSVTLVMKHKDRVIAHWSKALGFRETPAWPPPRKLGELPPFGDKPRGYTLWPRQSLTNPRADNLKLAAEFTRAIVHNRKHTPSITHINELYGLLAELNLPKDGYRMRELLTAVITRDSVAGHGTLLEIQKPSGTVGVSVPGFIWDSCEHMLFGKSGEERNRRRYGEIGSGISESEIERQVLGLDPFSWLYIRRRGPEWCIVDAYDERLMV